MANSPGIVAARMTSMIQFHGSSIFTFPRLARLSEADSGIRCLERNYGSWNGPVRYIPKKGVKKVEEGRESLSVEVKTESREISDGKAMTFEVSRKEVGDRSWVWKGEVPGSTESRKASNGEAMTFEVSRKEVGNRSWVRKGEVPVSTESQTISDSKAATFKVSRKEVDDRSWVRKGPGFNRGRVCDNNVRTNFFASPVSGILKNQYKQDTAAEEEISQILDEVDDGDVEVPEQDGEEIILQPSKDDDSEVLVSGKGRNDVEEKAIQLLATRAYTAVELRKKLRNKHFPPEIVEALINDFQKRGLINDSLYAEAFSRSRWSSSCWGPGRIKHELYKKGVNQVDAENAVKLVFQDDDLHGEQGSPGQALSKISLEHLYAQASKQWGRSRGVPNETRKSRLIRWLQYRGFNWGVISSILRKLESQASL